MPLTDVFLCSLPPHACCTLFPLVSSCISHLSASHPEHAHLIHTDGQVGLQKLPTAITLSSPPDPLGTLVWVCDDCRRLFSTRAGFAAHWKQDRKHRTWAARTLSEEGERGCNRFINATARGMVIKARAEVNNYFVSAAAREAHEQNKRSIVIPAAAAVDLPPPQFRVHVGPPFATRSLLISLTADTIADLSAQLALAWGIGGNQPPWTDLLEAGLRIRFDHRDGTAGTLLVRSDRGVKKMKEIIKYGLAQVGGVSSVGM